MFNIKVVMEDWKDIPGYKGLYTINKFGDIKNHHGKLRKSHLKKGLTYIMLFKDGVGVYMGVHIAVARAFIPNPLNYKNVKFIDEDKKNYAMSNLIWISNRFEKLNWAQVRSIRRLRSDGMEMKRIAVMFDVGEKTISRVVRNISYQKIKTNLLTQ